MSDEMNARIAEVKDQLLHWQQAKAELPRAREKLTEETHRLHRLEACIEELEQQIHALETFSFTSLVESLTGGKQRKLDERRAELAEFEPQLQEALTAFQEVEKQVAELEAAVTEGAGAEAAFRAACQEKERAILSRGDEQSQKLAAVVQEFEAVSTVLRAAQKAQEIGRQLGKNLESLDRAVRNAKHNKRLAGNNIGAIGRVMNQAVAGMAPKSATQPVVDGLRRFVRELGELPLSDHHDDVDLARIRAELEVFQTRLTAELATLMNWEDIQTLPVQQQLQVAMSHLKDWIADLTAQAAAVEQQRNDLIETA